MYDWELNVSVIIELTKPTLNIEHEYEFVAQVCEEVTRQVRALGKDWQKATPEEIIPTIEVTIQDDDDLAWRLFRTNAELAPYPPSNFEDAWDYIRGVANWVFEQLLTTILNHAYERGSYVTLETGERGKPGHIMTTYRLVDKKQIDVREEVTAEMVNQLVRGGWKVVR